MGEMNDREHIFIFTGPNGAGRKTVAEMAGSTLHMTQVLSYSTRDRRPNEEQGRDYYFTTPAAFREAEQDGKFIEVLAIDGELYGVKGTDIARQMQRDGAVYLILNRYGADILKNLYGDRVKRIFIYADRDTLIARQRDRGDSEELISRYMSHYDEEMEYRTACEYAYENIDLAHTVFDVTKALEQHLDRGLVDLD